MKLRRLTLHGFKSFADRTEIQFHEGITAIVGPNGCGKSNISDAIRWVLGEQRPTAIRGARMDEAIFQGTQARRGLNRAEVALVVSNGDRLLPLPQDEVEVRRTVFREEGSEYELNRESVRLRDILDVCRDTGLGTNAYAVIEQGMVDAILSERADERRHLFEEAAGIGRYKDRRKTAQRRLDAGEGDLARLEDVISEVETKVRSLARQRRKAERFQDLRARRLGLDVAVAAADLDGVAETLAEAEARLSDVSKDEPSRRAELSAAEADLEQRRLQAADVARQRNEAAQELDRLRRRIAERDRELAVAQERRAHAQRRLQQIETDRDELRRRMATLRDEIDRLEVEGGRRREEFEALAQQVADVRDRQRTMREELAAARQLEEKARVREEELARRITQLGADAAAADARAADAAERGERLELEESELASELARLDEQGDLFATRTEELSARRDDVRADLDACREQLRALRAEEQEAKRAFQEAEDRASLLAARLAAVEALERDGQGFAPAVVAALESREKLDGLLGPLAEFLDLDRQRAAVVEGALGAFLQALVVEDDAAVERVEAWLQSDDSRSGVLALLPKDTIPRVHALLEAIRFVGRPSAEPVLIGRRERLATLRGEAEEAARLRDARAAARSSLAERASGTESELHELESTVQAVELELRRLEADEAARTDQRARAERARDELERRRSGLRAAAEQARAEAVSARQERDRLASELETRRQDREQAADALRERQAAWETVRDEEAELRIAHAREEAALAEMDRRRVGAAEAVEHAEGRIRSLDAEEEEHHRTLVELETLRTEAEADLERLFGERDTSSDALSALDEQLAEAGSAADVLEKRARELRSAVELRGEERHRLELQVAEGAAVRRRVHERLELEWGKSFEELAGQIEPAEGAPDALRAEQQQVILDLERLGPVNMLAVEEYEEEKERLGFLTGQRDDLVQARDDLQAAIRQINRTARQLFHETFEQVRQHFQHTFGTLFEGGECDLRLEDPEDPLESPVVVSASPRGKRTQRIHLLSGGERALTALALLFAIYLVKPSPFCVLDEVDAPLDEANIGRFLAMLQEFKRETQFIVITHTPRTMEAADWIYGVTMEEPGISTIVGVQMDEVLAMESVD
ncbi:MAG: AAA family ATPase [Gemmatimonadota bacterium]